MPKHSFFTMRPFLLCAYRAWAACGSPDDMNGYKRKRTFSLEKVLFGVGVDGFEPPTLCL